MNTFDLQTHSTASDGVLAPDELVRKSKELGLDVIALTDHDTVSGAGLALKTGEELGVEVIRGVELSCENNGKGLHMLGYGIKLDYAPMLAKLAVMGEARKARAREIVRRLKEQGFEVEYENVEKRALGGIVGRPHITYEVLENTANREKLGGLNTMHEFINAYIVPGKPAYVASHELTAREAIELVHNADGVAVWSHPAVHFPESGEGLEVVLRELVGFGLDGVEVFSSSHNEARVKFLRSILPKYSLLVTAGSDFHSEPRDDEEIEEGGRTPGDYATYGFDTKEVVPRLKEAMARAESA